MSDLREFYVQGWGPDETETIVLCPRPECLWEHTWTEPTTLGVIMDMVDDHRRAHRD